MEKKTGLPLGSGHDADRLLRPRAVIWQGDKTCDLCSKPITGTLYDAATRMGSWATLCEKCFGKIGIGLGQGRGQKYRQDTAHRDQLFFKVEG